MTPQEIGSYVSNALTLILALIAIGAKRVRAPADDQARIDAGIRILEQQIARTDESQSRWLEIEKYLREQLERANAKVDEKDDEVEQLRVLLRTTNTQLLELTRERDELNRRIRNLARKFSNGEHITLADILGDDISELEDELANS
jgi:uncharacterized coiled-coil DUF342 family protein